MIDSELKKQIVKNISESISNDKEIIDLVITYLEKINTAKKSQELDSVLDEIYQKFHSNED